WKNCRARRPKGRSPKTRNEAKRRWPISAVDLSATSLTARTGSLRRAYFSPTLGAGPVTRPLVTIRDVPRAAIGMGPPVPIDTIHPFEHWDHLRHRRCLRDCSTAWEPAGALFQRWWRFVGPRTHNNGGPPGTTTARACPKNNYIRSFGTWSGTSLGPVPGSLPTASCWNGLLTRRTKLPFLHSCNGTSRSFS